jgi:hypothetical protein
MTKIQKKICTETLFITNTQLYAITSDSIPDVILNEKCCYQHGYYSQWLQSYGEINLRCGYKTTFIVTRYLTVVNAFIYPELSLL